MPERITAMDYYDRIFGAEEATMRGSRPKFCDYPSNLSHSGPGNFGRNKNTLTGAAGDGRKRKDNLWISTLSVFRWPLLQIGALQPLAISASPLVLLGRAVRSDPQNNKILKYKKKNRPMISISSGPTAFIFRGGDLAGRGGLVQSFRLRFAGKRCKIKSLHRLGL